jgi:hypothetical protein
MASLLTPSVRLSSTLSSDRRELTVEALSPGGGGEGRVRGGFLSAFICANLRPHEFKEVEELTLFTKEGCEKCEYVKKSVDLRKLGVKEEVLGPDNPDSLAHLAWHELVALAETQLPILVLDDSSSVIGAIRIRNYLLAIRNHS